MVALSRRSFVAGTAVLASVPSAAFGREGARAEPERLFRTPQDNLRAYVKLVGSTAAEMLYTHYQGVLYGVIPNEVPMPLVRFEALGKARWTPQQDGSYLRKSHDLGFFGDLKTRMPIDNFLNPYTKESVRPLHYKNGRGETLYTANRPAAAMGGSENGGRSGTLRSRLDGLGG
jgi:hypothetical protein